jgi:hypothetical protein
MRRREGWTIEVGTVEEMEAKRLDYWRSLTPQERLDMMFAIRREVLGDDAERLERTYRIVEVPRR